MIKLRQILENKLEGLSIQQLIDKFLKFDGKNLIFFNTETMGLTPEEEFCQITQIGIVVIDGSTMKDIKKINIKVGLNDYTTKFLDKTSPARLAYEKSKLVTKNTMSPEQVLDMTKYFENLPEKPATEARAIEFFKRVVDQTKNPILIAHNAKFDMSFMNVRGRRYGIQIKPVPVIDSKKIAELFFIPAIVALNDSKLIKSLKKFKLVKVKDIDNNPDKTLTKSTETEFDRYTDPTTGEEYLKIYYGHPSSSLGKLSPALLDKLENWHTALADVQTMIEVFSKIVEYLRAHPDLDVTKQQALAIRKAKSFAINQKKKEKSK